MRQMEGQDWSERTRSYLASTLPLDTGRAIMFLREQGSIKTPETVDSLQNSSQDKLCKISGQEAKAFYEEVLSTPQEQKRPQLKGLSSKSKQTFKTTKHKTMRQKPKAREKVATIGQVFQFAQDGELNSLKAALSERHFDLNTTDTFGWTLLMSAAYAGHSDTVEYLLSVGAEWRTMLDSSGQSAVELALSAGHKALAEFIEHYDDDVNCSIEETANSLDSNSISNGYNKDFEDTMHTADNNDTGRECVSKGSYFCEICQLTITQGTPHKHSTSTLHQFNCQHQPSPHTVYGIPHSNRGYQMLLRKGWDPEAGLGSEQQGQQFPVKTILKRDRLGFGIEGKSKARVTHFEAGDTAAIRKPSEEYLRRDKPLKKKEIVRAAAKDKQWELRMRHYMNTDSDY